jgi:O-Antigen ligase
MVKQTYLGFWLACLVIAPIYVFGRGLPQPADFLLAFLVLILATGYVVRVPVFMDLFLVAGLFLAHAIVVNLFWHARLGERGFLLHALYYVFNFGAFMIVVSLLREFGERFINPCRVAFAIAIAFEIVVLFALPGSRLRAAGTFNNPNQLGYWAILVSCCMLVLRRDQRLSMFDLAVLCGAGYLTTASLSKAAMLSFVLLMVLAFVFQRPQRSVKALLLALAFLGTMALAADGTLINRFLTLEAPSRVVDRLDDIGGQADDSTGGRGYDRIWRYPEYLLLGAGEGASWRFSGYLVNNMDERELHSTFGTVLFSYGIVGFVLFLALLVVVFRPAPLAHALYSLPIWMYGMTHQGLRDTMLWVFLGLVFGLAQLWPSLKPSPSGRSPGSRPDRIPGGLPDAPPRLGRAGAPGRQGARAVTGGVKSDGYRQ